MERERDPGEARVEREVADHTEDPAEREDGRIERAEAVYGDTDMNPNADDQRSAHHAEADEHL